MNGSLIDDLMGQLQGPSLGPIAQQLGTDADTAGQAIAAALPMLVGALGRNAQQPGGAGALFEALQRDHAGSGAMDLGGLLGGLLGGVGGGLGRTVGRQAASSGMTFATTHPLGRVAQRYYAAGRALDAASLKQAFAGLLDEARGLAPRYSGQIEQKAATIDVRNLASLIKQA